MMLTPHPHWEEEASLMMDRIYLRRSSTNGILTLHTRPLTSVIFVASIIVMSLINLDHGHLIQGVIRSNANKQAQTRQMDSLLRRHSFSNARGGRRRFNDARIQILKNEPPSLRDSDLSSSKANDVFGQENSKFALARRRYMLAGSSVLLASLSDARGRSARAQRWDPSYAFVDNVRTPEEGWEAPEVTSESTTRAIQIASRLGKLGAIMYGAYWCPHCNSQKNMFGKEAMKKIKYIECAEDGKDTATKSLACTALAGYPTWEIDGAQFPGERTFDEFETILDTIETSRPPGASIGWTRKFLEELSKKDRGN